jgi:hypothetical protein
MGQLLCVPKQSESYLIIIPDCCIYLQVQMSKLNLKPELHPTYGWQAIKQYGPINIAKKSYVYKDPTN